MSDAGISLINGDTPASFSEQRPRVSDSRSVSQYRLPNKKSRVSSGKSFISRCWAKGASTFGSPESLMTALALNRIRPVGAMGHVADDFAMDVPGAA